MQSAVFRLLVRSLACEMSSTRADKKEKREKLVIQVRKNWLPLCSGANAGAGWPAVAPTICRRIMYSSECRDPLCCDSLGWPWLGQPAGQRAAVFAPTRAVCIATPRNSWQLVSPPVNRNRNGDETTCQLRPSELSSSAGEQFALFADGCSTTKAP